MLMPARGGSRAHRRCLALCVLCLAFALLQGDVESIAQKSPKELTELVELISGSATLKPAYDEAKAHLESVEEEFTASFEEKRLMQKEKHQMKAQKEEAEEYNETLTNHQATKRNFFLFQLFHLQTDIDKKKREAAAVAKVRHSSLACLRS